MFSYLLWPSGSLVNLFLSKCSKFTWLKCLKTFFISTFFRLFLFNFILKYFVFYYNRYRSAHVFLEVGRVEIKILFFF